MEQELTVNEQYLKGFNQGYTLSEHAPDLVDKLMKNNFPENEYFSGFKAGNQEYNMEKSRERLHGKAHDNSPSKDVSKNKGREK